MEDRRFFYWTRSNTVWKNVLQRTTLTHVLSLHTSMNADDDDGGGGSREWALRPGGRRLPSILFNDPTESRGGMDQIVRMGPSNGNESTAVGGFASVVRNAIRTHQFIRNIGPAEEPSEADLTNHLVFGNVGSADAPAAIDHHVEVPSESHVETTGLGMIKNIVKKVYSETLGNLTFNPKSAVTYYWTAIVSACCVYNCLALAIFIFDDVYYEAFWPWFGLNALADFIYIGDIFVQSRFNIMIDGLTVRNVHLLYKDYRAKNLFLLDILCIFPTDFILFYMPTCSLLRTNRLLKMYRVVDFVNMTEKRLSSKNQNISKLFYLVIVCYVIFHWNACIYFYFSLDQGIDNAEPTDFIFGYTKVFNVYLSKCKLFMADMDACIYPENSTDNRENYVTEMLEYWQSRTIQLEFTNFSKEYTMSLYWSALTITTCGQQPWPANSAQNLLEVVDTLIGLFVFATILGSVGNVVSSFNADRTAFQLMLDRTKFYMKYRKVDKGLQLRAQKCLMYSYDNSQLDNEQDTLSCLPPRLEGMLAVHVHMTTIIKAKLFERCDFGFMYELVLKLRQQFYSPGDYICQKGERAQAMYIVKKGTCVVIDDALGTHRIRKGEGSTYGELGIIHVPGLSHEIRETALMAMGYADVYCLTRDDVSLVLQDHPEERIKLIEQARLLYLTGDEDELDENAKDDDGIMETLSFDDKAAKLREYVRDLHAKVDQIYDEFTESSSRFKKRVTDLETLSKSLRIRRNHSLNSSF